MAEWLKVLACKVSGESYHRFKSYQCYILKLKYPNETLLKNLKQIYGISTHKAKTLAIAIGITPKTLLKDISAKKIDRIYQILNYYNNLNSSEAIHKNLSRFHKTNVQRLISINSYRGRRHRFRLPVRGQRTKTNANSCKISRV